MVRLGPVRPGEASKLGQVSSVLVRSGQVRSIRSGQVDQENSGQGFRSGHVVQSGEIRSVCEFRLGQVSSGQVGQLR